MSNLELYIKLLKENKTEHLGDNKDYIPIISAIGMALRPKVYLELGVGWAFCIDEIAPLFKCWNCDLNVCDISLETRERMKISELVTFHGISTDKLAEIWTKPIDMLFIDADHSHEQSLKDFINFSKFVNDQGIIFMHDTHPIDSSWIKKGYTDDSYKTAWKIRTDDGIRKDFEICTIPIAHGLSIIRKSNKQVSWMV